ncbi:hypothetical protein DJ568_16145 [Mucilaginibacter hurinus]|uniref:carbonic anhydrase n=1 Tax=Mucilaginibacter hurinus TaxID=2201324 RepID=A0A367GLC1_9SPHI|nr:carbonic anhydrase family protein [Mucilaginibacter hurinus]RCH53768.1 hypothetical protein DJ568_16145 [Mucilaginibacter hurinus]
MNILFRLLLTAFIALTIGSCKKTITVTKEAAHWEYENPNWQDIGYKQCGGNSQSPINVETAKVLTSGGLSGIEFDYAPFPLKIVDNGHTIQVNASNQESSILYNNTKYNFVQLHFHHASEHKINNSASQMELHCVHRDNAGNLLVLAYMIDEGAENELLEQALSHVPDEVNKERDFPSVQIDLASFQPANQAYYTYFGSLTTPPCSASVQFIIFKEHIQASRDQIEDFASHHHNNARPVQPLNNRIILEKL